MQTSKPELLLPVGNIESFYAAIDGGADAIYLGLKGFNARGRASNFTQSQLASICNIAKQKHIKVYITLNIVVKNNELPTLLDTLQCLSRLPITAVIIQDWGVFALIKQHFPNIVVHASTQMVIHNSIGAQYCQQVGFDRVVLARELTTNELQLIHQRTNIETEVFVHGALCYSISGLCLFSSYLGGASANRGLCTQPCRRFYNCHGEKRTFFSLKDNQLITRIDDLSQMGVCSLKVEGRLKSGEYVNTVAQAYRKAIDGTKVQTIDDLSRPKTEWFMNRHIADAIADNPNTGILIGKVVDCHDGTISFTSNIELSKGNRLRIRTDNDSDQNAFILDNFRISNNTYIAKGFKGKAEPNTDIYLTAYRVQKFNTTLPSNSTQEIKLAQNRKREIIQSVRKQLNSNAKPITIIRIDNLEWLKAPAIAKANVIIISIPKTQWNQLLNIKLAPDLQAKIWVELPTFIGEKSIDTVRHLCNLLSKSRYNRFVVSHLSQILFLPKQSRFAANEHVYAYNDAAALWIKQQGAEWVISPVENEYENLLTGACRNMVIPLYFYPRLFTSRMPIKMLNNQFTDERKNHYLRHRINGLTVITPNKPVCITQYTNKLRGKNFNKFLLDLSFEHPDNNHIIKLFKLLNTSVGIQGLSTFNMKKGLR